MMTSFTAHGTTYQNVEEAQERINVLEARNAIAGVGPSDGRVTEILLIQEAIKANK